METAIDFAQIEENNITLWRYYKYPSHGKWELVIKMIMLQCPWVFNYSNANAKSFWVFILEFEIEMKMLH
jgi:hypothetical protein